MVLIGMEIATTREFIGNLEAVHHFRVALKAHPCRIALSGPIGSGKTCLSKLMIAELGMQLMQIDATVLQTLKNLEDPKKNKMGGVLCEYTKATTIDAFFDPTPKCIFVDDVDMLLASFPKLMTWLQEWLDSPQSKRYSLVCTVPVKEEKRVAELKGGLELIRLARPSLQACMPFMRAACDRRGIAYDEGKLQDLITKNQGDVRAILENIEQLRDHKAKVQVIRTTFSEMSLFDAQNALLSQRHSIAAMDDILHNDNNLLALLLYENAATELKKYREVGKDAEAITRDLLRITDAYVAGDAMNEYLNRTVTWDLMPIVNATMLGTVQHVVNQYPRKSDKCEGYKFTTLMTKTAQRYLYTRKKNAWIDKWGVGDTHFLQMAHVVAQHMASNSPKQSHMLLDKLDIDIAAKYGQDFGLLDASRATSWRKHGRKMCATIANDDESA